MIKKYLEFAIENGYKKFDKYKDVEMEITTYEDENFIEFDWDWFMIEQSYSIEYIITSKPFIESIARGLSKDIKKESVRKTDIIFNTYDKFELIHRKDDNMKRWMIREITTRQAIAIRDWELDSFIEKLITNK